MGKGKLSNRKKDGERAKMCPECKGKVLEPSMLKTWYE